MASYSVEFAANVRKDFRKIPAADAEKILTKIHELTSTPRPIGSRKLKGEELYRIRIGMCRVVYEIEENRLVVLVVRVKHRKDVYRH
ncbi:MAG: type II toxin-antitoxin system RelE/ParE family toxin [Kiritimatiellae bacterium]|nr:type II toxin-antitoxin system RelE/ParE family toxin [Kiritimatiellia bacterium]